MSGVMLQGKWTAPDQNQYCSGQFSYDSTLTIPQETFFDAVVGDFDDNGRTDVFLPGARLNAVPGGGHAPRLFTSHSSGWQDKSALLSPDAFLHGTSAASCDIDDDGDLDIVEAGRAAGGQPGTAREPRIHINGLAQGAFGFSGISLAPAVSHAEAVECTDLNGDGLPELVFGLAAGPGNVLLMNQGALLFSNVSAMLPTLPNPKGPFRHIEELTRTSALAICTTEDQSTQPTLLFGNGGADGAKAQPNLALRFPATNAASVMGLGFASALGRTITLLCRDLDGDGLADTLFVGNSGARDYLYRYTGPP